MSTSKHNEMSAILGLKSKHDVKIDAMNKQIFILNGKSKKVSKKMIQVQGHGEKLIF